MSRCKQYYYFGLDRWQDQHDSHPLPGSGKGHARNTEWFHMLNSEIILTGPSGTGTAKRTVRNLYSAAPALGGVDRILFERISTHKTSFLARFACTLAVSTRL